MKKISACRCCGSPALSPALDLHAGSGMRLLSRRRKARPFTQYVFCDPRIDANACGLVQMAYEGCGEGMWAAPEERAGPSRQRRADLQDLVSEVRELVPGDRPVVLDIGCGDGTALTLLSAGAQRYGVDPSDATECVGEWAWTARDWFPSEALMRETGPAAFDIVIAAATLDRVERPRAFLEAAKAALRPEGVLVVETAYLPLALTRNMVDAFHERARAVYTLAALERLASETGLKIVRGGLNEAEGGSIRLFLTHPENTAFDDEKRLAHLARLWDEEAALCLRSDQPYQAFQHRLDAARTEILKTIHALKASGKQACVLGASSREAALCRWIGADSATLPYAMTADARIDGQRLGEAGPEIVCRRTFDEVDADLVIAPWRSRREALEGARDLIQAGVEVLIPTPEPVVVNAHNYAVELGKALSGGGAARGVDTLRAVLFAMGGPKAVPDDSAERLAAQAG